MFSLESPQRGDFNEYTQYIISQYKKENHPNCSKGPKNEFETAVVNEPSVFEPLKFYCILKETSEAKSGIEPSFVSTLCAIRYNTCQNFYHLHVLCHELFAAYAKFGCILCKTE